MNRRFSVWVGSILGIFSAIFSLAGIAAGQASPGTLAGSTIPAAALLAADETPYLSAINKFVQEQLTALTGDDFTAQTAARDKLKTQLNRGSSPAYYTAFSKAWTADCNAILAKNPTVGVRLNIAIVTFTLADNGSTLDAQPMVLTLLKDREPCVMLWGIKAAKPLIVIVVQNQPTAVSASPLPAGVVAAVKACGTSEVSGFATVDAYSALAVKTIPGLAEGLVKPLRPPLVKPVLEVVEIRISQHAAGSVQSPGAERDISTWLSGVYPDLGVGPTVSEQQKRLVQDLVTLETYVGQRADLYQNNKKDLAQIREMLKYVTSALKVIANSIAPNAEGGRLNWLTGVPPAAPPSDILQHTVQLFPTMQLVIHTLTAPPPIPVIAPPPPPATKPAVPAPAAAP